MIRIRKNFGYLGILGLILVAGVGLLMAAQRVDYLKYKLEVKPGDLVVDRMPSTDPNSKSYQEEFFYTVTNPMRSDYKGTARTTQTFDVEVFFVGVDKETSVWKWSKGHVFGQVVTTVSIEAVHNWKPTEKIVWTFKAAEVKDGKYRAVASFIPTGNKQTVANFTITSAH